MKFLGINAGRMAGYSADVLSGVFGFGDMKYFAGIKLFNKVIDRLGINMDQQRQYEVFDEFMRKECEIRSSSEIGIVDRLRIWVLWHRL